MLFRSPKQRLSIPIFKLLYLSNQAAIPSSPTLDVRPEFIGGRGDIFDAEIDCEGELSALIRGVVGGAVEDDQEDGVGEVAEEV